MPKEHAPFPRRFSSLPRRELSIILSETHAKPKHPLKMICRAAAGLLIFATANNSEFRLPIPVPDTQTDKTTTDLLPMNVASAIQSIDHILTER